MDQPQNQILQWNRDKIDEVKDIDREIEQTKNVFKLAKQKLDMKLETLEAKRQDYQYDLQHESSEKTRKNLNDLISDKTEEIDQLTEQKVRGLQQYKAVLDCANKNLKVVTEFLNNGQLEKPFLCEHKVENVDQSTET